MIDFYDRDRSTTLSSGLVLVCLALSAWFPDGVSAALIGPSPASGVDTNVNLTISCTGFGWFLFSPAGGGQIDGGNCAGLGPVYNIFSITGDTTNGDYHFVETSSGATDCTGSHTYADCLASGHVTDDEIYTSGSAPPPSPGVATTSTTTLEVVDNPSLDFFLGVILFWIPVFFFVYVWKRK